MKKYYCIKPTHNNEITYQSVLYGLGSCEECGHSIQSLKLSIKYKKEGNPFFGKHHTEESRKRLSLAGGGTGIPYEDTEYPQEFYKIRKQIRKRDNYTCQKCFITEEEHLIVYGKVLAVHHIDYDKDNCNKENLLTLCNECNLRVNYNRDYWTEYFASKIEEFHNGTISHFT